MKNLARGVTEQRGVLNVVTSGLLSGRLAPSLLSVPPVAARIRIGNRKAHTKGKESSMDRDTILRLAREAGWSGIYSQWVSPTEREHLTVPVTMEQIERFAALVAAHEREACIDIVAMHGGSVEIEAHIRSRT